MIFFFLCKSDLILEEPESFQPWLTYLFKSQQDRLIAIADEIHEEDDVVEVCLDLVYGDFMLKCGAVLFATSF